MLVNDGSCLSKIYLNHQKFDKFGSSTEFDYLQVATIHK